MRVKQFLKRPEVEFLGTAIAFLSSVIALYQFFGLKVGAVGTAVVLAYYIRESYRRGRRMRQAEERLRRELPPQHAFLVEFIRQTYRLPSNPNITERNAGLTVHSYQNDFIVSGADCANRQEIRGSNTSTQPALGLCFALVGGSSVSARDIGARYRLQGGVEREPTFIQDEERFKVAFCEFVSPLAPGKEFILSYRDVWRGSMRIDADGFIFPESLYFPSGIHRLGARIEFSFRVATVAVLEVDVAGARVSTCRSQPEPTTPRDGMAAAYDWFVDSPSRDSVFMWYYRSVQDESNSTSIS